MHHPRLDWAAVGMSTLAVVMIGVGLTVLGIVGFEASEDDFADWQLSVVTVGLFGGVLAAIGGSVLALVAKLRHEHWVWLWFPLLFGPVFILTMPLWFE